MVNIIGQDTRTGQECGAVLSGLNRINSKTTRTGKECGGAGAVAVRTYPGGQTVTFAGATAGSCKLVFTTALIQTPVAGMGNYALILNPAA